MTLLSNVSAYVGGTPVKAMYLGQSQVWRRKLRSLTDTFDTGSQWSWTGGGTAATPIFDGRLTLSDEGQQWLELAASGTFDLTNSSIAVELVSTSPVTGTGYRNFYFTLANMVAGKPAGTVEFDVETNASNHLELHVYKSLQQEYTVIASAEYNPTAHRWLRIRHDGTNVLWDISPDGSTWTLFHSMAPIFPVDNLTVLFGIGSDEPTTVSWDNLNLLP